MKALGAALVMLIVGAGPAAAQSSVTATIGATSASMADRGTAAATQNDLNGSAAIEHLSLGERLRVYYGVDGGTYQGAGDWSYWVHTPGLTYVWGGDGDRDRRVYLNASFTLRRNGSAWAAADYAAAGVGVNAEFHPADSVTARAGYRLDRRSFADTLALTQVEHGAFGSVLLNLETRTTVIGEVQLGAKSYHGQLVDSATVPVASPLGLFTSTHGMGPGLRVARPMTAASSTETSSVGVATGLLRVAQSVTDRTGLYVQTAVRTTFGGVPPALVATPAGFADDGVYDDPFASRSTSVQVGLTTEWSNGGQLRGSGAWSDRRYTSTIALDLTGVDLPGSPLRADRVWRASAIWSQPVLTGRTGAVALSVDTGYRFTRSRSNDAFYSYTSHGIGVSLSVRY